MESQELGSYKTGGGDILGLETAFAVKHDLPATRVLSLPELFPRGVPRVEGHLRECRPAMVLMTFQRGQASGLSARLPSSTTRSSANPWGSVERFIWCPSCVPRGPVMMMSVWTSLEEADVFLRGLHDQAIQHSLASLLPHPVRKYRRLLGSCRPTITPAQFQMLNLRHRASEKFDGSYRQRQQFPNPDQQFVDTLCR